MNAIKLRPGVIRRYVGLALIVLSLAAAFSGAAVRADDQPAAPAAAPAAGDDDAPPGDLQVVTMSYQGKTKGTEPVKGGGGFVGAINDITNQIIAMGNLALAQATFTVDVTPVLNTDDPRQWRVTINVSRQLLRITPGMEPADEAGVRREAAFVLRSLNNWSVNLTADQAQHLVDTGNLSLPVKEPFAPLKLLTKPSLTVTVHKSPKPGFKLLVSTPDGLRSVKQLMVGVPTMVELVFPRAADKPEYPVEVAVGYGKIQLTAKKTADPLRYRTDLFLPWPADAPLGPPPPRTVGR